MKISLLNFVIQVLIFTSCSTRELYIQMDYDEFDQGKNGWRKVEEEKDGNYKEAAQLIIYYLENKTDLSKRQKEILNFHAGQMFAYVNDYSAAQQYFSNAFSEKVNELEEKYWNAYINATIYFLRGDKPALEKTYKIMSMLPSLDGVQPNLTIVKSFTENISRSYKEAYQTSFMLRSR